MFIFVKNVLDIDDKRKIIYNPTSRKDGEHSGAFSFTHFLCKCIILVQIPQRQILIQGFKYN